MARFLQGFTLREGQCPQCFGYHKDWEEHSRNGTFHPKCKNLHIDWNMCCDTVGLECQVCHVRHYKYYRCETAGTSITEIDRPIRPGASSSE